MATVSTTSLAALLTGAGLTDVRDDAATLATRSTDASLYRVVPQVGVEPVGVGLGDGLAGADGCEVRAGGGGDVVVGEHDTRVLPQPEAELLCPGDGGRVRERLQATVLQLHGGDREHDQHEGHEHGAQADGEDGGLPVVVTQASGEAAAHQNLGTVCRASEPTVTGVSDHAAGVRGTGTATSTRTATTSPGSSLPQPP